MELSQIFHKNIPQKNKVFALFYAQEHQDISKHLLKMIKQVKKETQDIRMINSFCIELHDILYYAIISRKIRIAKKVLRLLEKLALPIRYTGEQQWNEVLKKICKIKV